MLPILPFNTSEEHVSFRGTVSLSPPTVMSVLEEVVVGLREQGFRKQVLTVGHGGSLWRGAFLKHVNRRFGDVVVVDAHRGAEPAWEEALREAMNPRRILGIAGSFYLAAEGFLHAIHRNFIVDSSLCALIDDARGG